ncbi:MAG: hypothetical protein DCC51_11325 [Anaerolineae bacterium]|nr:MAG: hypothetical protein DCC51_11325 [Anaerolineae bacterium]
MRVGMVSATYDPSVVNGAVRMVTLYKERLEALGHEVTIFTLGEAEESDREARIVRSPGLRLGSYGYYLSMGYTREAQALLGRMDIVHCHHLMMSVEMAHRYVNCPIVYTNHTRYDLYTGTYTPLPQPAADAIMRQVWPEFTDLADVVIVPSESVRRVLLEFGVRARIVVIENGIVLEPFLRPRQPRAKADFDLPESARLLVYVGRLAEEKNLDVLLRQFAVARQLIPELCLVVIGKGPQEAELRGIAGELGPLTVIEAMAAGKPVAAVRSPGILDSVESGVTGYLTNTPEGLDAAIVALMSDPARTQAMGSAARQASMRYDIDLTVDKTVKLYEELLSTRPDIDREQPHGRWLKRTEKWSALLDQLADMVRPSDEADAAGRSWWPRGAPGPRKQSDG